MRKTFFLLLAGLCCLTTVAQKRKVQAVDAITQAREAMAAYDFDKAIEVLEDKIAAENKKRRGKQPTVQEETLLEVARKNKIMLEATEVVTFIDSLVVAKEEMLKSLNISDECGSVESFAEYFKQPDSLDCSVYINQMRNRIIYGALDTKGSHHLRLFQRELIGGQWKQAEMLPIPTYSENDELNYPFLLDDGLTLYYAAQREDGLGGYDIYMTRYDNDDHTFLSAENVGMPFNSPANDYMLAFDEYYQLGYLLTDRNQPEGQVCLYIFIPNETRQIYNEDLFDEETIRQRARLSSIAATWTDAQETAKAKERLEAQKKSRQQTKTQKDFTFLVNNRKTFHHLEQFKPEAQEKVKAWQENTKKYESNKERLDVLRQKYAISILEKKQSMTAEILSLERETEQAYTVCRKLEKEIRQIESK